MSDDGFLRRWSRRKAAAEPEPAPPAPAIVRAPVEDPPFDPESLPPIESLAPGSDISAFLRKNVPAALKSAALARVWTANPAIRDYVGPADYAWDWNTPGGVPGLFTPSSGGVEEAVKLAERMLGLGEPPVPAPPASAAERPASAPVLPPAAPAVAATVPAPAEPASRRHGSALPRIPPVDDT
jgi:hypothetical protein